MELIALFGGIVGSLATLTATKMLEVYQRSRQDELELQKLLFNRQLSVAETAVSRFLALYTSVSDEIHFCRIHADHDDADDEYMSNLREDIENARERIHELTPELYPFWLYFDVDEYVIFPDSLSRRLHEARLGATTAYYRWAAIQDEPSEYSDQELQLEDLRERTSTELKNAYHNLATVLEEVRARYLQAVKVVKQHLVASQQLGVFRSGGAVLRRSSPSSH